MRFGIPFLRVATFVAYSWLCACPAADSPQYHIDVWKSDEGLPQSSITSIIQSHEGYLWLGTFGGLARFDGVQFKTFSARKNTNLTRRILSIFEGRDRVLWAGVEDGDLIRVERAQEKVYPVPNLGSSTPFIRDFAETPDGTLWLHTAENRLIRFASEKFTVVSATWNLRGTNVNSIWSDSTGTLWVGTDRELARYEAGEFKAVWSDSNEPNFGVDILTSGEDGVWVAGNGKLRLFARDHWAKDYANYPWSKGVLTCLVEDRDGQVWAGTYGSGIFKYATNGQCVQISRSAGLPGNEIRSLHADKEGNLWVGTEGRGLARLKPAIFTSYGRAQGLGSDLVTSLCEGDGGELWIASNGEGIDRLKDGKIEHFKANEGLSNECVWSVVIDSRKQLWAGTWGGGLFKFAGNRFTPVGINNGLGQIVCGLYEDSKSRLWIGQMWNQPVVTTLQAGVLEPYSLPTSLNRTDARAIVEDKFGDIWIGTRGDGLYRLHDGLFSRYSGDSGLVSDFILSLYADADGVLWVGTRDGLTRMQGGRSTSFTTKEGLPDNAICFITEDDAGHLWFGSGSGVFQMAKAGLARAVAGAREPVNCHSFTRADGLPSLDCTSGCQPAGCKTRDGRLWFPTVNGLAVVDPRRVPFNPIPPTVLVEELFVENADRVTTQDSRNGRGTDYDLSLMRSTAEPLRIGPGKARFEFHYTALSLTAPEKVHFKYKLEGLEKEWLDAGSQRTALYSYLPPGHYNFRVLACNNDGVWNEAGASLAMILLPHFWQTWWFRTLAGATVVLCLAGIYELRLAAARRLLRLRLRIARDLHDEVGSNLGSIALLSEVNKIGGGKEEALEIRRIAVSTIDSLRDIVWFLDPASDNMTDLQLKMKDTARSMLPGIGFEFNAPEDTNGAKPPLELRRNLFPIYKEILHNVAKHSRAGQVEIEVQNTARFFTLRVHDNGKGFDERTIQPGNGLKNLRRRTAEMGGKIDIESQPGEGTTITVTAPIT